MTSSRILPATQTLAALQPHTLAIEMKYTRQQFENSLAGGADTRPLEVVAHELCHWFDIVGTVWGQSYLETLFDALDYAVRPRFEVGAYAPAIKLFDLDRSILFPSYYKYVRSDAVRDKGPGRWRMEITTGARVDVFGVSREDDPILFVHFSSGEQDIGRQPVSIGSLLELRAVFSEFAAYQHVARNWPTDEKVVGDHLFERRVLESLYDPELITYSAAAHFVGRVLDEKDSIQAFGLGSMLSDFALNLTPEAFGLLRPAVQMNGWGAARIGGFLRNQDRGFAFGSLAFNAQIVPPAATAPMKVATVLLASGLMHPTAIYGPAEDYIRGLTGDRIKDPRLREIRQKLLAAGREVIAFRRVTMRPINIGDWQHLRTPPILDTDVTSFFVGPEALSFSDVEYLVDCDFQLRDVTRQALRASRGLDFAYTDWLY